LPEVTLIARIVEHVRSLSEWLRRLGGARRHQRNCPPGRRRPAESGGRPRSIRGSRLGVIPRGRRISGAVDRLVFDRDGVVV